MTAGFGPSVFPVLLARVSGSPKAHLLAARLGSEGIECRLSGGVDSPYRMTVGPMAMVDIWVHPDDLDDAKTVLLAAEVDDTLGGRLSDERPLRPAVPLAWVAVLGLLVSLLIAALARFI